MFQLSPPVISPRDPGSQRWSYKPYFKKFQLSLLVISPEILVAKGGTMWVGNGLWILPEMPDFHVTFRNLLHATNLQHGTDGSTSPQKEGVLRIFFALRNPTASAGFEPANLGTKGHGTIVGIHHCFSIFGIFVYLCFYSGLLWCSWFLVPHLDFVF